MNRNEKIECIIKSNIYLIDVNAAVVNKLMSELSIDDIKELKAISNKFSEYASKAKKMIDKDLYE